MTSKIGESNLKRRIKSMMPVYLQRYIYNIIKKMRVTKNKFSDSYNKKDLKRFLIDSGLKQGDKIIVHSSLSRIGYVKGGADALIDSFLEIIGDRGLLIMPAFCAPEFDNNRKIYLFDSVKTQVNTGKVPEVFRKRDETYRSLSSTHSLVAKGEKAEEFVKDHENCDTPYSMKGPFGKLYDWDVKIFFIGTDQRSNPSLHIIEDKCKFPFEIYDKPFKVAIKNSKGIETIFNARKHLPHLFKIRNNNLVEKYLDQDNLMEKYPFGKTELRIVSVRDLVNCMEKMLKKGITIYP
tara:strand:+ start:13619 stop:14497 length:879 start_codon:yes stop_codon:yes gene_type:complete